MSIVRVAIVGAGGQGQAAHLKQYASLDNCKIVAIAEIKRELAQKVAARYGIDKIYSGHEELLEKEEIDAIVACQHFAVHDQLLPELLKKGKPIFVEKPLAHSVEAAETIIKAEQQSNTWIMTGYHKQSDPATMLVKEKIREFTETGRLGRMKYVRITIPIGDWIAGGHFDRIETDEELPGGMYKGAVYESPTKYFWFICYYIHHVNLLRHLLGESYKVTFADKGDMILCTESESGITGLIEMNPYKTPHDWHEAALVAFEKGYIKLTLPAPLALNRAGTVEIYEDVDDTPVKTIPTLPWVGAMRQQAMNFLAAVAGEREPMCPTQEGLEDLTTAESYIELFNKMSST